MVRTLSKLVLALVLVALVAGCSNQEFNRPYTSYITDMFDSGEAYLDPGKSPDEIRLERLSRIIEARQIMPERKVREYLIGPGDLLEVKIFGLESPEKTAVIESRVSREGYIVLPLAGRVRAGGLSVSQLVDAVRRAYSGKFLKDPMVSARIVDFRSVSINVTGAVNKPGVYYLKENTTTVLAILSRAGGLVKEASREAGDELLVIRPERPSELTGGFEGGAAVSPPLSRDVQTSTDTGKKPFRSPQTRTISPGRPQRVIRIDLKELVEEGNPLYNIEVANGDTVSVPPRDEEKEQVYVLGFVQRPRSVPVRYGRIEVLYAIARAGGLNRVARAENSFVVREVGEGMQPLVVAVDLTKITRGVRPPLYLQPGDTLVVGSTPLARFAQFIIPATTTGLRYTLPVAD